MIKLNVSKGWAIYLAFTWGLWVAIICMVIDGTIIWNMGYTTHFMLHIVANILVLWLSVIKERFLEEEEEE